MSLDQVFSSIFNTTTSQEILFPSFVLCLCVSLALGVWIAWTHMYKTKHSKGFVLTLATLPVVVAMVILMVNGNIGTGVAVAGTFSLIRFRSYPGTAKEIASIFLAMSAGLATGMGYLALAVFFVLFVTLASIVLTISPLGEEKMAHRVLVITMPEDLDYTNVFEDLFQMYTTSCQLQRVKTINMGSLFKLSYHVDLKDVSQEKQFVDDLRCRNGNLEIVMARHETQGVEL